MTGPDTHFSFIMSFSGNNLSQTQNGEVSNKCSGGGEKGKADLFFWMNENDLHCRPSCIQMEPPRVSCASVLFNLETVPLLIGGRIRGRGVCLSGLEFEVVTMADMSGSQPGLRLNNTCAFRFCRRTYSLAPRKASWPSRHPSPDASFGTCGLRLRNSLACCY